MPDLKDGESIEIQGSARKPYVTGSNAPQVACEPRICQEATPTGNLGGGIERRLPLLRVCGRPVE